MKLPSGVCSACLLLVYLLSGCAGKDSFSKSVRAGDTVAVAVGWRQNLSKDNISINFLPGAVGVVEPIASYGPNDPAIRAVINLYPDPLSSLSVSPQIQEDLTPNAQLHATLADRSYAGNDKDLSQTVVFLDLPPTLPEGIVRIQVSGGGHDDPPVSRVEILPGQGAPANFDTEGGYLTESHLQSLERVDNHVITFSGDATPHAIEVSLTHDPDRDAGGTGKAHVVNTRGDIKSVVWHDDGVNLKVLLSPVNEQPLSDLREFKFYVAGGVTGLSLADVQAFDADGNALSGVNAVLTASP